MHRDELISRAADAILAEVPTGYGMTRDEAIAYATAALEVEQPIPVGWDLVKGLENGSIALDDDMKPYRMAALPAGSEQPVAVEEWQPIETAPHEINVLLAWPDSSLSGGWRMEAGMASWGWRRSGVSNMSSHGQATHWRPLPTPPSSPHTSASSAEAGGSAISTKGQSHE